MPYVLSVDEVYDVLVDNANEFGRVRMTPEEIADRCPFGPRVVAAALTILRLHRFVVCLCRFDEDDDYWIYVPDMSEILFGDCSPRDPRFVVEGVRS